MKPTPIVSGYVAFRLGSSKTTACGHSSMGIDRIERATLLARLDLVGVAVSHES